MALTGNEPISAENLKDALAAMKQEVGGGVVLYDNPDNSTNGGTIALSSDAGQFSVLEVAGLSFSDYFSFRYVNIDGYTGTTKIYCPFTDISLNPSVGVVEVTVSGSNLTVTRMIVKKVIGYR